jgi:hypothetical protein
MSETEIYCENCDCVMAPDWTTPYCPMCGGKVAPIEKEKLKPRKPKQPSNKTGYRGWGRVRKKIDAEEGRLLEQARSDAFDTLRQTPAAGIFFSDALTFGLRSLFWAMHRLPTLDKMAMRGEISRRSAIYLWFVAYMTMFLMAFASGRELFLSQWDFMSLAGSRFPPAGLGAFAVSFVTGRHILFWAREVIMDAVERDRDEAVRLKAGDFAPSLFLLWFLGAAYLQHHLNEILRARNLASFKSSKRPG